ncbi:MAG: hypothetical protein FE048_00745 [Thermoplasmata archaeon]|nr:MAG: hypothetical protein FE048_00745 [Thermoplasmata archaeon]
MEKRENIVYPIHLNLFITLQSLKEPGWWKDFSESLFSLILCTFGDLITGVVIGVSTSSLQALPALLILIPPAIGMRGNIFASLGSRLGTYLHTGQISLTFRGKILSQNMNSSFILTVLMSFYLGMLAAFTAKFLGLEAKATDMILISMIGGILSAFFMLAFTISTAFFSYKLGWDPDNVTTPLITLVGDIITLPLLFFSMSIVLNISYEEKLIFLFFFIALGIISIFLPFSKISKPYCKRIVMETTPVLLVCGILGTLSGSLLGNSFEELIGIAGILTMIPAFLEDGGAIGGILAAKFSSALHIGSMRYSKKPPKEAQKLFLSMHVIGFIIFSLIGVFAFAISSTLGIDVLPLHEMVCISVISGELLIVMVNFIAYYSSITSFKIGLDPDNVTIPIITSTMDILGTVCLIAILLLFGVV